MSPPELAADAPVLNVVHPLVVGVDPVLGNKAHGTIFDRINRLLGNRLAARLVQRRLVHGDKPLVGQHWFDHLAGARAPWNHQPVPFYLDQQRERLQIGDHLFACHKAVHSAVGGGRVVVDARIQIQHADDRQCVALSDRVVVGVVRRRHLDDAGAKSRVHIGVGNDGDAALA